MEQGFKDWMGNVKCYAPGTVYSYSRAINKISGHYSSKTGKNIYLYQLNDIDILKSICKEYSTVGKYAVFGNRGHGTNRAAITAYVSYIEAVEEKESKDKTNKGNNELKLSTDNEEITVKKKSQQEISINIRVIGEKVKI